MIAWRLSPKGHEVLQSKPLAPRQSDYDNIKLSQGPVRYSTASQQEVTSSVSHFVSSRNEANLAANSGRHSAEQYVPRSQPTFNGRHSADLLDDYPTTQPSTQRLFSSQQNLSTYQPPGPYRQEQQQNGHHGNKHVSRRDQQLRHKSSDDVRWENYLGMAENGRVEDTQPRDQFRDAYPRDRYGAEEFRNVSSSWENLYDSADLSMVHSDSHQVSSPCKARSAVKATFAHFKSSCSFEQAPLVSP